MAAPRVRLLLKGELVQEIPFDRPSLRIGRMKENDLVVNNLSVSRFHATLSQTDGGFAVEDLGSENGIWVNGRRVKACRVGPGDRIQVGKHEIQIVPDGETAPAAAPHGRSDAWDAATTYLAGPDTQARMVAAAETPAPRSGEPEPLDLAGLDTDGDLVPPAAPASPAEDLFGDPPDADLQAPDLAEFDVSEIDLRDPEPIATEAPSEADPEPATELFDASPREATAQRAVEPAAPAAPPASAPQPEPALAPGAGHAGLIVQRNGRLERVVQWDGERMILGRATECDIVLATPEVSRRHAMLVRSGDRYEVRDLESINGTFVNGEKVTRRALAVGDVVRVEDFELTFVLDRAPVGDAVRAEAAVPGAPGGPDPGLTQIGEMLDLAPFVAEEAPEDVATAMSFEPLEAEAAPEPPGEPEDVAPIESLGEPEDVARIESLAGEELDALDEAPELAPDPPFEAGELFDAPEAPREPEPDTELLVEETDEEKDLVESPREAGVLRLELRVRMEELPPALREALSALDPSDLRLPVELRLATED